MKKYDWCVCDMDGTLLDSRHIISEENVKALQKLQQDKTEVIIASGRIDLMVKSYIRQLDLKGHVISCNGGLIRSIMTGEILYSRPMEKDTVREIINFCQDRKIHYMVYTAELIFTDKGNPRAVAYEEFNRILDRSLSFEIRYVEPEDMQQLMSCELLKVLLIGEDQEQVDSLIHRFEGNKDLTVVSSAVGLVDIMAANTTKGGALKVLAERLGVDLGKVIAFGDNYNDIEMLQCVGMPIAMENSVEPLKAVAKYITRSNDASGIAYAIDHYIYEENCSKQ